MFGGAGMAWHGIIGAWRMALGMAWHGMAWHGIAHGMHIASVRLLLVLRLYLARARIGFAGLHLAVRSMCAAIGSRTTVGAMRLLFFVVAGVLAVIHLSAEVNFTERGGASI